MTLNLAMITFDSTDPGPLARWWAAQAGGTILEVHMPVTQLMGGSSTSLRFFTFQKL